MIPAGNYLLIGRSGVGKSSLINTVAQSNIVNTDNAYACTQRISSHSFETPAGNYVFYDSPGFCEDDNPETDKAYYCALRRHISAKLNEGIEITLLLVVKSGSKRIRSEDFEVVKYLGRLVTKYQMPVAFVATWADFGSGGDVVRNHLDQLRLQYLSMLDATVLKATHKRLCAGGFDGAYIVDNNSGAWMSSFKSLMDWRIDSPPDSSHGYGAIIGHSDEFVREWIAAAGHDLEDLVRISATNLIDSRIYNLTRYPFNVNSEVLDLVSVSPLRLKCYFPGSLAFTVESGSALEYAIDSVHYKIYDLFRIRSTRWANKKLGDLPCNYQACISDLLPIALSAGFDETKCKYLVSLYAAREICLGLYQIAGARKISILAPQKLVDRISVFGEMLVKLLEAPGDLYLVQDLIPLAKAALFLPALHDFDILTEHLKNISGLFYLATVFAEWACFPRSRSATIYECWFPHMKDVMDWLKEEGILDSHSDLLTQDFSLDVNSHTASEFIDYASNLPQCMPALVDYVLLRLRENPYWIVSAGKKKEIWTTQEKIWAENERRYALMGIICDEDLDDEYPNGMPVLW